MKKNIFDSKFEVVNNLKEKQITLMPYFIGIFAFGLVLIGISLWSDELVDNYHQERTNNEIQTVLEDNIIYDNTDLITSTFVASDEVLGQGKDTILTSMSTTDIIDSSLILGSGASYRYEDVVKPGVYMVNYNLDDEVAVGEMDDLSYEGYLLGETAYGYLPNKLYNVAIDGDETLFIESPLEDFEVEFTVQDSYHMFDEGNIEAGIYAAGQAIDPGRYEFWSTDDMSTWLSLQTENEVVILNSEDTKEFTLEPGESIAINVKNLAMRKIN